MRHRQLVLFVLAVGLLAVCTLRRLPASVGIQPQRTGRDEAQRVAPQALSSSAAPRPGAEVLREFVAFSQANCEVSRGKNVFRYIWNCTRLQDKLLPDQMRDPRPPPPSIFDPDGSISTHNKFHTILGPVFFFGHTLDWVIAQVFFLHPAPVFNGRYLEIGAQHGLQASNTFVFDYYLDWEGWLFEPTQCYDLLETNRPRAESFQQGLCPTATTMDFGKFGSCLATTGIPCTPLTSVGGGRDLSSGFDFISIDVEGAELSTLLAIDFALIPVKVVVTECLGCGDFPQRVAYMQQFGYEHATLDHWPVHDTIWWRPDLITPQDGFWL